MKAAYADPPYLGCGAKHYGKIHAAAADYDTPEAHKRLIERLCDEYGAWPRFFLGRVKFVGAKHNCPVDCMLLVFRRYA